MVKPPGGRVHHFGHEPNHHFATGFTWSTHREAALGAVRGSAAGGRVHHFGHVPNHHFSTGFTEPTHREAALDARSGITAGGRVHHFGHEPNHHFSTGFTEPTHREAALGAGSGITAGGRVHHFGAWGSSCANSLDVGRFVDDEPDHNAPTEPLPISFCAHNRSRTNCRRTAARVSDSPPGWRTLALAHLVGKAYGLPTAPESLWHRQRRFPLSTRRLCHFTVAPGAKRKALQRARRAHSAIVVRSDPLALRVDEAVTEAESKIDNPLSGSCWRGRWPRPDPVPEIGR